MTSAYPLAWPEGWKRANEGRSGARFRSTFDQTRKRLYRELELLGAKNVVVSSNVPVRADGYPYADVARYIIRDPGAALYFTLRGRQMVMARDAYESVYDNLHSLTLAIEHLRGLERHGGATMMERAFEGFAALPEPGNASHVRLWWQVLGFTADPSPGDNGLDHAEARYRQLARERHPDTGGTHHQMAELNAAIAQARKQLAS